MGGNPARGGARPCPHRVRCACACEWHGEWGCTGPMGKGVERKEFRWLGAQKRGPRVGRIGRLCASAAARRIAWACPEVTPCGTARQRASTSSEALLPGGAAVQVDPGVCIGRVEAPHGLHGLPRVGWSAFWVALEPGCTPHRLGRSIIFWSFFCVFIWW